jgi:hypothetical protein
MGTYPVAVILQDTTIRHNTRHSNKHSTQNYTKNNVHTTHNEYNANTITTTIININKYKQYTIH